MKGNNVMPIKDVMNLVHYTKTLIHTFHIHLRLLVQVTCCSW